MIHLDHKIIRVHLFITRKTWLGDGLNLFLPILFYTTSLRFRGLQDINVVCVFLAKESTYSIYPGQFGSVKIPTPNSHLALAPPHLQGFSSRSPWTDKRSRHHIHVQDQKRQQRISFLYAPSRQVQMNSLTASLNGWNFGGGGAPKVMHFCDCNHRQDSRGAGRGMYGGNGNWINDDNNFKESRKYNDHNEDDCHHQRCHAPRIWDNGRNRGWKQHW